MKILVTGGAGFIGSVLVRHLIHEVGFRVVNVDKLTYAANEQALDSVRCGSAYHFEHLDICDAAAVRGVFQRHKPDAVVHMAAESHVDRSIDVSEVFIQTNIVGTHTLLQVALEYWREQQHSNISTFQFPFRFLHVSTDEVYGDLGLEGEFSESSPYRPNSPYSASKAAADHLVRAWNRTYGLPTLQTNSSNNYGPWQHEEKLIPRMVGRALVGKALPIFGSGKQVRDWLHVEDNARGITEVLMHGKSGETYNIGGGCELENLTIVQSICTILDELIESKPAGITSFSKLIHHVDDRPGHDFRYALNTGKIRHELNWSPQVEFATGFRETVQHIVQHGSEEAM